MKRRPAKKRDLRRPGSEGTREWIIARTATLLNTSGYLGTPMSEIMRVTGLKKGGIYHHFKSREALALAAFQYSAGLVRARVLQVLASDGSAKAKLLALIGVFRNLLVHDVLQGGCPIVNLAIESDDAHPQLRAAARDAMARLLARVFEVIDQGMKRGDFAKGDALACASSIVAALEGGIVLSNLYRDQKYLKSIADRLEAEVSAGLQ
jgi:AcrR family transcriptional regulator